MVALQFPSFKHLIESRNLKTTNATTPPRHLRKNPEAHGKQQRHHCMQAGEHPTATGQAQVNTELIPSGGEQMLANGDRMDSTIVRGELRTTTTTTINGRKQLPHQNRDLPNFLPLLCLSPVHTLTKEGVMAEDHGVQDLHLFLYKKLLLRQLQAAQLNLTSCKRFLSPRKRDRLLRLTVPSTLLARQGQNRHPHNQCQLGRSSTKAMRNEM